MVAGEHGRVRLPLADSRPHMFLKELSLHLERLREDLARRSEGLPTPGMPDPAKVRDELAAGISHYRVLAGERFARGKTGFRRRLAALGKELEALKP